MSADLDAILRDLRPADAARPSEVFGTAARAALLDAIVARPRPRGARTRGPSRRPARRAALVLAAAAALAAVVLLAGRGAVREPAADAVTFTVAGGGDVVATVTNPFAARRTLDAAFARHHIDISIALVPVAPSDVGTIVYESDDGGASAIQPLQGGHCVTGGGGCPIGLRVPSTFRGKGYIALGRPARPSESYVVQASAFAPGEPLHCSGLHGARASALERALPALGLRVTRWREDVTRGSTSVSRTLAGPVGDDHVWDVLMVAPSAVTVFLAPTPWPGTAAVGSGYDRGC